jgi:hypothetical protein
VVRWPAACKGLLNHKGCSTTRTARPNDCSTNPGGAPCRASRLKPASCCPRSTMPACVTARRGAEAATGRHHSRRWSTPLMLRRRQHPRAPPPRTVRLQPRRRTGAIGHPGQRMSPRAIEPMRPMRRQSLRKPRIRNPGKSREQPTNPKRRPIVLMRKAPRMRLQAQLICSAR